MQNKKKIKWPSNDSGAQSICWVPLIESHQDMEATEVPINRPMDREDVVCRSDRILLSHKKNEVLPFAATWMDLKSTVKCQTGKDKYCVTT